MAVDQTFEGLYERYSLDVYRFCLYQLRDPDLAADIVADVFAAALPALGRSAPIDDPRVWLIRIARNAIINHQKRNARWRRIVGILSREAATIEQPDPESIIALGDDMQRLLGILSMLTEKQRLLVGLRFGSDLTYEEISTLTGMTSRAAAKATARAVDRLRDAMGRDGNEG